MTMENYLNRAELLIQIATLAIEKGQFERFKRAMALSKVCLKAATHANRHNY